jgi:hypothetical protein
VDENAARPPRRRARSATSAQITPRDRVLLAFMAEHRLVLAAHGQSLLGISAPAAGARLRVLRGAGYVDRERKLHDEPAAWQITRDGLRAIGSDLSRPRPIDLSCYRHDVGLAGLWLAARSGSFGALRGIVSERRMRSHDGVAGGEAPALGVRLDGSGADGRRRLHYPDLILETASGHRVAVELELSSKSRGRRERILAGYGAEGRIDAVLYVVDRPSVGRAIEQSAAGYGMADRVHVQKVRLAPVGRGDRDGRTVERSRGVARGRDAGWVPEAGQ